MTPAARMDGVGLSLIRRMQTGAPPGAVSLGLGEPTWPLPPEATKALAGLGDECSYGPNAGVPELREAIAAFYGDEPERVMVGSGSQGVLFALFQAWAEPGRSVLVPDPGFVAYPALARLAGASPEPYPLGPGGALDADRFIEALDGCPRASLAVINHPGNPSGGGASAADLARVAGACRSRGVLLVSDEVYRELYLGERPPSLRDVDRDGVVLSSVSKAWGGPGLRVGWAVGDEAVLEPARLVHNYMATAAARPSQAAALALVRASGTVLPAAREALRSRWTALRSALARHLEREALLPSGGFYYWLPLPNAALEDPLSFCLGLRDSGGVIVVPGVAFGERGRAYARVSYSGEPASIAEGVARLAPFWREP